MPTPTPKKKYTVTVEANGTSYTAKADTAFDAIQQIKPEKIATRTIFTVAYNKKSASIPLNIGRARRVFLSDIVAQILVRNLLMRLR
jgi:hypothetical protein